jgi:hypothetical protein
MIQIRPNAPAFIRMNDKNNGRELTSWSEIAAYLGVTERTAQRYEELRNLPVRRQPGPRGRVSTTTAELDRWKESNLQGPPWWLNIRFVGTYAAAATILLLIAGGMLAGIYVSRTVPGQPAAFRVEPRALYVTDSAGREVFHQFFKESLDIRHFRTEEARRMLEFEDIDGDGRTETLLNFEPIDRDETGTAIICFDDKGREKWRFRPGRAITCREGKYTDQFFTDHFQFVQLGREKLNRIITINHHVRRWPSQFAVLDSSGRLLTEYWHPGRLYLMKLFDMDQDGSPEVLLAGVNNGYQSATMVILDPRTAKGTARQEDGDPYQILNMAEGTEKVRVIFPRSCINKKLKQYNRINGVAVSGDRIQVRVHEKDDDVYAEVLYTFDRNLKVTDYMWSLHLRDVHRELQLRGVLDHALSEHEMAAMRQVRILKRP